MSPGRLSSTSVAPFPHLQAGVWEGERSWRPPCSAHHASSIQRHLKASVSELLTTQCPQASHKGSLASDTATWVSLLTHAVFCLPLPAVWDSCFWPREEAGGYDRPSLHQLRTQGL